MISNLYHKDLALVYTIKLTIKIKIDNYALFSCNLANSFLILFCSPIKNSRSLIQGFFITSLYDAKSLQINDHLY